MYVYIINLMINLDLKIDLNLLMCVCMDGTSSSRVRTPYQSALPFWVCDSKDDTDPFFSCNTF